MHSSDRSPWLAQDDPAPVERFNPSGRSPFLLIADHAGVAIPRHLEGLGVDEQDMARHIASDLGIRDLALALSARIDAPLVMQHYSRLVIDCNRDPARADAIPEVSDGTAIPGNMALSTAERAARVAAIHAPYHDAIAALLDARREMPTILVALHSFTPAMQGVARPWQIGILHDGGDLRFVHALLAVLQVRGDLNVGDNEPYRMDSIDYSIPHHAYPRGLPYAEIELRQDLLTGRQTGAMLDLVEESLAAARAALDMGGDPKEESG